MKLVIQRSKKADVKVENEIVGEIDSGLVVLLGISNEDTENDIKALVNKLINLRIFCADEKNFDKSILESKQSILLISQFTLYANCKKGRRPDFNESARAEIAKPLYEKFIEELRNNDIKVATGKFGAEMKVSLVNDGPVTIILESNNLN